METLAGVVRFISSYPRWAKLLLVGNLACIVLTLILAPRSSSDEKASAENRGRILRIDGVELFPESESAEIQVNAFVNGTEFRYPSIAGVGAILAIFHKSLEVSRKISDWASSRSQFCLLRFDYEILLNRMRFDPEFSVEECSKNLDDLLKRFPDSFQKTKVDAFLTGRLKHKAQDELDVLIKNRQ